MYKYILCRKKEYMLLVVFATPFSWAHLKLFELDFQFRNAQYNYNPYTCQQNATVTFIVDK